MKTVGIPCLVPEPYRDLLTRIAEHEDKPLAKMIRNHLAIMLDDFRQKNPDVFDRLNVDQLSPFAITAVQKVGRPRKET